MNEQEIRFNDDGEIVLNTDPKEIHSTTSPLGKIRIVDEDFLAWQQLLDEEFEEFRTEIERIGTDGQIDKEEIPQLQKGLLNKIDHVIGTSKELTARMLLPPREVTDIYLLPAGLFQRLEEYRSDEKAIYLFIGILGGAILGILSNWVTNEPFVITRISVILTVVFSALGATCGFRAWLIHKRVARIKKRILPSDNPLEDE